MQFYKWDEYGPKGDSNNSYCAHSLDIEVAFSLWEPNPMAHHHFTHTHTHGVHPTDTAELPCEVLCGYSHSEMNKSSFV